MIPEAKSSAPLIDDTDHPHVEVGHGYSDCVEILEMTSISHAPSAGSRGGAQPLGQAAPISRPRQLGVVGVVDEALLIQEMDGRTSPFDCRTPDTGLGAGQGAGQGSSAGPGASRSPNPRNTFQASRRTSKRNKSYSYKDFLPEWTVQPSVDQTFKLVLY